MLTSGRLPGALALLLALTGAPASAQIVNTLGGWDRETGWGGKIGLGGDLTGGNTDVRSLTGAARIQWRGEAVRVRVLGRVQIKEAEGERVQEDSMGHLRVARRVGPVLLPFAFAQIQRNPFRRLRTRWLLGAGLEVDLARSEDWSLSVGASPMLEAERIEDSSAGTVSRGRLSTFVLLSLPVAEKVEAGLSGFYQPRMSKPADFRSNLSGSLEITVAGPLAFQVTGGWEHDDAPPEGVDPDDWDTAFGLTLKL